MNGSMQHQDTGSMFGEQKNKKCCLKILGIDSGILTDEEILEFISNYVVPSAIKALFYDNFNDFYVLYLGDIQSMYCLIGKTFDMMNHQVHFLPLLDSFVIKNVYLSLTNDDLGEIFSTFGNVFEVKNFHVLPNSSKFLHVLSGTRQITYLLRAEDSEVSIPITVMHPPYTFHVKHLCLGCLEQGHSLLTCPNDAGLVPFPEIVSSVSEANIDDDEPIIIKQELIFIKEDNEEMVSKDIDIRMSTTNTPPLDLCQDSSSCADYQVCGVGDKGYRECFNVCESTQCGLNALCRGKDHHSLCECRPGFSGNPIDFGVGCQPVPKDKSNSNCPDNRICRPTPSGIGGCIVTNEKNTSKSTPVSPGISEDSENSSVTNEKNTLRTTPVSPGNSEDSESSLGSKDVAINSNGKDNGLVNRKELKEDNLKPARSVKGIFTPPSLLVDIIENANGPMLPKNIIKILNIDARNKGNVLSYVLQFTPNVKDALVQLRKILKEYTSSERNVDSNVFKRSKRKLSTIINVLKGFEHNY